MTFDEFIQKFDIKLNDQQLAAVRSVNDPTLLLAVPGSGKTTVLVTRLGYMIYCCGIEPEHILTVTYTVAATKDMKTRFAAMFGGELANRLEFRTINGICAKIINYYGNRVGKNTFDLVTDEGHKSKLLSEIYIKLLQDYPTESDLKNLSMQITYIKNMMLTEEKISQLGEQLELPLLEIYSGYCGEMRRRAQMDYDDQMIYALAMLKKSQEILDYFQNIYQYICVDEAQDTSKIQHEIIGVLAGKYENLFMVGDEDQSIYGFRAAYPEALLDFEKNHMDAQVLLMEENFRSNAKIVMAADRFIQKNEFRHKKSMKAAREDGADVKNIEMKSRKGQYSYLVKVAQQCDVQTAVLYRDNESILPVVDLLERKGFSYKIKNADLTFFTHRVVRDVQNVIQFAANPEDTELFMQIYYKIGTYMNKKTANDACRLSEEKHIPVLEAAFRLDHVAAGTQKSMRSIQMDLQKLLEEPAERAIYRIADSMGYESYLERMHIKNSKLEILKAIAVNEPSALSLSERLQELAELIKNKKYDPTCNFILSTIHSSKGLEYERVYLMDVKDGIFPENVIVNRKKAAQEELKLYEEERRLFYVGVTRAKNNLCVFTFKDGSVFGRELLGLDQTKAASEVEKKSVKNSYLTKSNQYQRKPQKRVIDEAEYLDKMKEITTTGRVKHKVFGEGILLSAEGDVIEVEFKTKKTKCLLKFMMEQGLIL